MRSLLAPEQWTALASAGTARTYEPGERLMTEGELGTFVVVLLEGRVKSTCCEDDGTEVLLSIRGAGDVLGERSVIDWAVRSATVTARRRCSTRFLTASQFMELLHEHLAEVTQRLAVSRQREGQTIRVEVSTLSVLRRLVRTLLRLVEAMDNASAGPVAVDLGIPQEELARAIGASRAQVAANLRLLRSAGIVSTGTRRIVTLDPTRLRAADAGHVHLTVGHASQPDTVTRTSSMER
jgi:CRP/FNR family cyclic AMP-dependent transcriptional regulator